MSERSDVTISRLHDALERILGGNPLIVKPKKTLSVAMVEREAGLGVGTAYYYSEIIQNIKDTRQVNGKRKSTTKKYPKNVLNLKQEIENKSLKIQELQYHLEKKVQSEANLVFQLLRAQEKIRDMEIAIKHNKSLNIFDKKINN